MEQLKKYFFTLFAVTLFAFGVFLAIIFNIDPDTADTLTLGALLASIFISISGFMTLVLFYFRVRASNREVLFAHLPIAMRHSALVALAATGLLLLQILRVLGWWEAALYLVIIIFLESYFRTRPSLHG